MGSYLSLGVSTFLLCLLLSSLWFTIAQSSESESKVEPIEVHELQITENKEKLSKLEAEGWNELGFSNITTSNETSLCKPYARQKLAELNVSRSLELEEYRNQLKRSHNQISDLSYNLTICSIKAQLHESESIDASTSALIVQIAELNAQIQAKDRQIEQLQQEMRWQSERLQSAQSELRRSARSVPSEQLPAVWHHLRHLSHQAIRPAILLRTLRCSLRRRRLDGHTAPHGRQ